MKIKIRIQRHLAIGHLAEDSGDWVFTCCRRGIEELLGRRAKPGEEVTVEISAREE